MSNESTTTDPAPAERLPEGEEAPPPGTRAMAIVRWALIAAMAVVAAGAWVHFAHETSEGHDRSAAAYRCPMHPAVVQSTAGSCPICGMDLVRAPEGARAVTVSTASGPGKFWCPMHPEVTSDDPAATCEKCGGMRLIPRASAPPSGGAVAGLTPIELSAERRQLIGLRTARAERRKLRDSVRAVGFVSADERKVAIVSARASGWIAELKVAQSGQRVKRGDVLLTLDSGEITSAQQAYVQNVKWKQNLAGTPNANNPATQNLDKDSRRRLELYGMAEVDIEALARRGEPSSVIPIRSPIFGWVARKSILPGQYVAAGTELYQIADLSAVWVVAALLEQDAARVAVGQRAHLTVPAHAGARFSGRVDFIYPAVNPESRTVEARMQFANPDLKLRPGMYGDVRVELGGADALTVPADAVVDTGDVRYVFVALGDGRFEPRLVRTGVRGDDRVEILAGLAAGDEVVTTANFYADAESRLRAGIDGRPAGGAAGAAPR